MPLLQFLAFYQVLEYYFPIASRREAINQTRSILKHPSFTVNDDHDMIRLLDAIAVSRSGAFGDERSQLRAVVESYVTAQDIRAFLNADEKFVEFYAGGKDWKTVSEVKIPLNNPTSDLRTEISERIYDLRCKIVHAKSDGGPAKSDTLLPFSNEAELLGFDIEVIRYIALQALTATSTPIDW